MCGKFLSEARREPLAAEHGLRRSSRITCRTLARGLEHNQRESFLLQPPGGDTRVAIRFVKWRCPEVKTQKLIVFIYSLSKSRTSLLLQGKLKPEPRIHHIAIQAFMFWIVKVAQDERRTLSDPPQRQSVPLS